MGWRVVEFRLDNRGNLASAFQFEVAIPADSSDDYYLLRGDGLLLSGDRVRLNRKSQIRSQACAAGIDGDHFIAALEHYVIDAVNKPSLQTT